MKKIIPLFLAGMILLSACTGTPGALLSSSGTDTPATQDNAPTTLPASAEAPENSGKPDGELEQTTITFKPCLAFDALTAISFRGSNVFRDIDGEIKKHFKGMPAVGQTNFYFDCLLEHYSFEEVESMDLQTLAEVFPDCLRTNEFIDPARLAFIKEQFIKGFEVLEEMDFTSLWEERCLPILTRQCEAADAALKADSKTEDLLADIRKLKSGAKLDDITIYVVYFDEGLSFQLSGDSYLTYFSNEYIHAAPILKLFAHELIHHFSNEQLKEIYRQTYQTDEFLKKMNHVLFVEYSSPSDEEEFVVALEHFVSFRNGLRTEQESYSSIASWYGGCMPVALIVFDELMKLDEIPKDINLWIYDLFANEIIKVGEIESKAESIKPKGRLPLLS